MLSLPCQLIETKMEMFKVCEKETKTKAYSKEGLSRVEQVAPEEQAKEDAKGVLQEFIEKLGVQMEAAEAEVGSGKVACAGTGSSGGRRLQRIGGGVGGIRVTRRG